MTDTFPMHELAIVKGLIEHKIGSSYFGPITSSYPYYYLSAVKMLWVTPLKMGEYHVVTEVGHRVYEKLQLGNLPTTGYAYTWSWNVQKAIWSKM